MNKGLSVLFAGGVLIAGAAAGYVAHRPPGSAAKLQSPEQIASQPAPVQPPVVRHVITIDTASRPGVPVNAPEPPVAAAASPEESTETPEELAFTMGAAFEADAPGDRKAVDTSRAIRAAFSVPAAAGVSIRNVECRATRCRLQLAFDDLDSDKRVLGKLFDLLSSQGVDIHGLRFIVPVREEAADGKTLATVHLYRDDGPS